MVKVAKVAIGNDAATPQPPAGLPGSTSGRRVGNPDPVAEGA
jgi:hypothetical protein